MAETDVIRTPDQRLRVFVSSTLQELAAERQAVRDAVRVRVPVILDGEIVVLHAGRPDFGVLQSRMHVRRPTRRLIESAPVRMYLFDLLYRGPGSLLEPPTPSAGPTLRASAWTPIRSGPRHGSATTRGPSWPSACSTAWREWWASRWRPVTTQAGAETGSR